jgi:hypothetical protein
MILILPVLEIRMFSIFKSGRGGNSAQWCKADCVCSGRPTSMDDRIPVTIIQRAGDLSGKLSRRPFSQPPMTDDIVQHLTAVDKLEDHVIMVRVHDHLPHPADIRVVQ